MRQAMGDIRSGTPFRYTALSAWSSTSKASEASKWLASAKPTTLRENASITTAR